MASRVKSTLSGTNTSYEKQFAVFIQYSKSMYEMVRTENGKRKKWEVNGQEDFFFLHRGTAK
jgi:hypothetical protein